MIRYFFLSLILMTVSAHATDTYYCDTGDDSTGAGTKASPWRTFQKATVTLDGGSAGDNVYLCEGGEFVYSTNTVNTTCTANNPCTIGAYQPDDINPADIGVKPVVVVDASSQHTGLTFDSGASYITVRDFHILASAWDNVSAAPWGVFLYHETDHITFDNMRFEDLAVGVHIYQNVEGYDPQDAPTIKNSHFENNWSVGAAGGSDNYHLINNTFNLNGSNTGGRPVYMGGDNVHDNLIVGNVMTNSAPSNIGNGVYAGVWTEGQFGCARDVLGAHGTHTNTFIKNNIVREDKTTVTGACWAFSVDTAYVEEDEHFIDLVFQNNESYYGGNSQYSCSNCTGVMFRENIGYSVNGGVGIRAASRTEDVPHPTTSMSALYNFLVFETVTTEGNLGIDGRYVDTTTVIADIQWNVIIFPDNTNNTCTSADSGSTVSNNFCFDVDGSGNFVVNTNYATK